MYNRLHHLDKEFLSQSGKFIQVLWYHCAEHSRNEYFHIQCNLWQQLRYHNILGWIIYYRTWLRVYHHFYSNLQQGMGVSEKWNWDNLRLYFSVCDFIGHRWYFSVVGAISGASSRGCGHMVFGKFWDRHLSEWNLVQVQNITFQQEPDKHS